MLSAVLMVRTNMDVKLAFSDVATISGELKMKPSAHVSTIMPQTVMLLIAISNSRWFHAEVVVNI